MSTHVGDIFFDEKINRKDYDKGLSAMGKSANALPRKLATAFSIGALVKFTKDATSAGASLNAMNAIVDASLPNMTAQVDAFAKSAGAMFGLSETQAKGFVGKFASMASAMGYTEKSAYNMSTALTGLAGDVASYYHISQDEAFQKLGAVFTGETESLKQLGVIMTQSALDAFALERGFGKTTRQMTELEKTTLRYQFVLDRLKLTNGDFAKYSNTWSGSLATLKLNWSNFMATVGQGLINILLPLLQVIAKLSNMLTVVGQKFLAFTEKITGKAKTAGSAINSALGSQTQSALNNTANAMENVGDSTDGVGDNAKKTKKQIQALKRELMGFDQITKLTKQDESTGTTGDTGTSGGSSVDLSNIDDATTKTTALGKAVDYLSKIQIPPALQTALEHLGEAWSGLFKVLKKAGSWVLKNVLEPLGKWLVNEALPVAVDLLAKAVKTCGKAFELLGTLLKPIWTYVIKPMFTFLGDMAIKAMEVAGKGIEKLGEVLGRAKKGFEALSGVVSSAVTKVKEKWNNLKDHIKDIKANISAKVATKWSDIKDKWHKITDNIKNKTVDMKAKIGTKWSDIKDKWNKLLGNFKDKVVNIGLKFSTVASDLKAWINDHVLSKVNNALANVPVVGDWLAQHPIWLAQGGYVKANTPQLAVIGDNKREGEIVAPESKMAEMARIASEGANAQTVALLTAILSAIQTMDTATYLDGEEIKNNVVRRINQHTRATGQLELVI